MALLEGFPTVIGFPVDSCKCKGLMELASERLRAARWSYCSVSTRLEWMPLIIIGSLGSVYLVVVLPNTKIGILISRVLRMRKMIGERGHAQRSGSIYL